MSLNSDPLIRLKQVQKVYFAGELETHALADIDLEVGKGEFLSIAGPSGCGKSTLLSIMGLLDTPSEGDYWLAGRHINDLSANDRAEIRSHDVGHIFQSFNLISDLSVYENVELPLTYGGLGSAERKRQVAEALERVKLGHRSQHMPNQLSGGEQQRVAVARAVAKGPSVLLADEPTGNLDSANGEAVLELLKELHRDGATICLVTHDARFASHAERTVHLFDGQLVSNDKMEGAE